MTTPAFSDATLRAAVESALVDAAPNGILTTQDADAASVTVDHWRLAARMGWTAALVDEPRGGLGLGLSHVADLCEETGRNLFCGPYAETAIFLPAIARETGGVLDDLLPAVAAGDVRVAYAEADLDAAVTGKPLLFDVVEHAPRATHLLVVDQKSDGMLGIFLADLSDVAVEALLPMDPTTPVARIELGDAAAGRTFRFNSESGERICRVMNIAIAADLLGCGEAALARAVVHASTRKQFGSAIGAFQAIKHRLADCYTALNCARLAIADAVRDHARTDDSELARILAGEAALRATSAAIQIHGGSGFSWEVDVHLYFKRAHRLAARNGGTGYLRATSTDRFIRQVLAQAA
jgi:alkylation response protein AidB-like acyl-CoA dehydrogenase